MARRRFVQRNGELVEVTPDYVPEPRTSLNILPDLPGYASPVDGAWVEGRKARREDLRRTGSRPYEGFEQESKEAARQRAYQEAKIDQSLERAAWKAWYELPPSKRRLLRGG